MPGPTHQPWRSSLRLGPRAAVGEGQQFAGRARPRGDPAGVRVRVAQRRRGSTAPRSSARSTSRAPSSRPRTVAASSTVSARVVTASPRTRVRSTGSTSRRSRRTPPRATRLAIGRPTATSTRAGATSSSPHHHAAERRRAWRPGRATTSPPRCATRRLVVLGHLEDTRAGREPRLRCDPARHGVVAQPRRARGLVEADHPVLVADTSAEGVSAVGCSPPFDAADTGVRIRPRWRNPRSARISLTEVAPTGYAGSTTRPSSAGAARRSWRGRTRTV